MNASFWQRMHGGSTHFPIVLLLVSVVFDFVAWRSRDEGLRRGLQMAGLGSAVVGVLGGLGAVISGLVMSRGQMLGSGYEKFHHLFVWPAFGLGAVLVAWRLFQPGRTPWRNFGVYLAGMGIASALMMGAGYWGGEMLLGAETPAASPPAPTTVAPLADATRGRQLFLLNCAHCHGVDARGDEGPDLHGLRKSDARLAAIITNGIRGEMPNFGKKLRPEDVQQLILFLHSLSPGERSDPD